MSIYHAVIHQEDGSYWAECAMPAGGCTAQGDTLQEVQRDMLEAVALYFDDAPETQNYLIAFEVSDA